MIDAHSHGRGSLRNRPFLTGALLLLALVAGPVSPLYSADSPAANRPSGAPRWKATAHPAQRTQAASSPAPSHEIEAVVWSYGCAAVAEFANWQGIALFPSRPILQSGLATLERTGSLRIECRALEARLLVAMAQYLFASEGDSERGAAAGHLERALSLLAPRSGSSSRDTALLSARAHLGLARLAPSSRERIGHCRNALEELKNADADHPQTWWVAGACHLTLADSAAFEEQDSANAREHYRRALPLLYRLRRVSPDGLERLARWHLHVAIFTWQQGDPAKAEEHALTARSLYGQFRDGLGVARVEHLLGQIAIYHNSSHDEAVEHLRAAWQAYERDRTQRTVGPAVAVIEGFNREACGLLLADLLFARGNSEQGQGLIDAVVGDRESTPSLDQVLGLLARSTVFEEQRGDAARALQEIENAKQLATQSRDSRVRRLGTLWSLTRRAETRSLVESPEVVAADLRSGLLGDQEPGSASAEETLARARALHLLANLEAATSAESSRAEGHLREALAAYRNALRQGAGSPGELGACYLDLAALQPPTEASQERSLPLLRQAAEHLASSVGQEPENWGLLAETHLATAHAIRATGGNEAVATGHFESAVETARQAVVRGTPGASVQRARLLSERAQWELERQNATSVTGAAPAVARERAVEWLEQACAHYRLGRGPGVEQAVLRDEVRCRIALAQLLAEQRDDRDSVIEQLGVTRNLLEAVSVHESGWHIEQARLDQFEASLLSDDPATIRQAAVRLASAIGHYEQALRQAETGLDEARHGLAAELEVALFNLADFYATHLQDAGGALEWFRRNLALQERIPMADAERDANQALVYMRMGLVESQLRRDPDRAAEYYRTSLERLSRAQAAGISDTELFVRVLVGLGMLGGQLPDVEDDAEEHFRDAAALALRTGPSAPRLWGFEYSARHGLALQYERRGRYSAAAEQMLRCITLAQQRGLESLPEDRVYLESLRRLAQAESPRRDGVGTVK